MPKKKIRTVLALVPPAEVLVTSKSLKKRKRKDPTGLLHPNDFCEVIGDSAYPLTSKVDEAILTVS